MLLFEFGGGGGGGWNCDCTIPKYISSHILKPIQCLRALELRRVLDLAGKGFLWGSLILKVSLEGVVKHAKYLGKAEMAD